LSRTYLAHHELESVVIIIISAAIFMSFFFVNLLPLAYETGPAKQQLSILLSFVKLISAYVDWEITRGGGVIVFDGIGRR